SVRREIDHRDDVIVLVLRRAAVGAGGDHRRENTELDECLRVRVGEIHIQPERLPPIRLSQVLHGMGSVAQVAGGMLETPPVPSAFFWSRNFRVSGPPRRSSTARKSPGTGDSTTKRVAPLGWSISRRTQCKNARSSDSFSS